MTDEALIRAVHHINFVVSDLDAAVEKYRALFGVEPGPSETLPERGIRLARFRVGEVWYVLVEPVDSDSVPGRHLAEHGEGFFLVSLEVDDVETAARQIAERGGALEDNVPRTGVDGWRVMDLEPLYGARLQLVESA